MKVSISFDGGMSPAPCYGYVIRDEDDSIVHQHGAVLPDGLTNNETEWCGMLAGLYKAKEMGARRVTVFGDSQLVIRQASGQYAVRAEHLIDFHVALTELVKEFEQISFRWVPREKNTLADKLGRSASL